jgi:hypothetical protein
MSRWNVWAFPRSSIFRICPRLKASALCPDWCGRFSSATIGGAAMADHERQAAAQGRIIRCWHVLRLRCRDDADSGRDAYDGGKYQSERVCHLPVPMDA